MMKNNIVEYQRKCFREYKSDIGYPEKYCYLYGNHINVLVPIETSLNRIMIVGAYPSAKFFTVNGISDTPLTDNDSPFSNESYFDGSRVRTIPSGKELNEVILSKIGIHREDCWITDLVKVFLFKNGHVKRYNKIKSDCIIKENRSEFNEYAKRSLKWLYEEIEICNPFLIILLGAEVTQAVFDLKSQIYSKEFLDGVAREKDILGIKRNFICLPHLGILMKTGVSKNFWPEKFDNEIAKRTKTEIDRIKKENQKG